MGELKERLKIFSSLLVPIGGKDNEAKTTKPGTMN
jgi:hypothetical protein